MKEIYENPWRIIHSKYPLLFKESLILKKIKAIDQIEKEEWDISSVSGLFSIFLKDEPPAVKHRASKFIDGFVKHTKKRTYYIDPDLLITFRYKYIPVTQINDLSQTSFSNSLLGLASFNQNGFVREAVLDKWLSMDMLLDSLMPFILLRLTDNVPIIKEKAIRLLKRAISQSSIKDILTHAKTFRHYSLRMKTNRQDLMEYIYAKIQENPSEELVASLNHWPSEGQILIIKSIQNEIQENQNLLKLTLDLALPNVKQWFSITAQQWELPPSSIYPLLSNSSSFLRRLGLRKIGPTFLNTFKSEVMALTTDPSRRVRQTARFLLREEGINKIRDYYYHQIEASKNPPFGVMMGVMEIASSEDLIKIKSFLNHENRFVRASALESLYKLDKNETSEALKNSLLDKSALVRKTAHIIQRKLTPYDAGASASDLFSSSVADFAKKFLY